MGMLQRNKVTRWCALGLIVVLMAFAAMQVVGLVFDIPSLSVFAAARQAEQYEIRSRLLMEAMDAVGVSSHQAAAKLWADGLVARSAAMQYAAMDTELREPYAARLEKTAPNWVTGVSSPWVEGYSIEGVGAHGAKACDVTILFHLMTSTGPAGEYRATLHLINAEGFWHVAGIDMDEGLYPYTGW